MLPSRFPSRLLENAVEDFASLPGIGRKTALRLVLHLLRRDRIECEKFGNDIIRLRNEISYCSVCHNISDNAICEICNDKKRDTGTICVVENIHNVMAFENTGQYKGVYHVLGGIISPVDGIGPADLEIDTLIAKAGSDEVKEIILALSTTMEGDTTNFYLYRKLSPCNVTITTLARGVAIGDELEYTDEVTLGRSLINRTPFSGS